MKDLPPWRVCPPSILFMKIIAENKKARFDYEILETLNAGVILTGHETKSLKLRGASMNASHVIIQNNEAFMIGLDIPSFQPTNAPANYVPGRTRKLLLKKDEIKNLLGKKQQGLTIIPLKVYYGKRGLVKIEIALARGRKKHDKRELLKKRDALREIKKNTK